MTPCASGRSTAVPRVSLCIWANQTAHSWLTDRFQHTYMIQFISQFLFLVSLWTYLQSAFFPSWRIPLDAGISHSTLELAQRWRLGWVYRTVECPIAHRAGGSSGLHRNKTLLVCLFGNDAGFISVWRIFRSTTDLRFGCFSWLPGKSVLKGCCHYWWSPHSTCFSFSLSLSLSLSLSKAGCIYVCVFQNG